jgi:DNA-binding transcriptional LysR family regulator
VALDDHGHFGNAARSLGISQPALSRAIQALEESIGTELFSRERSGVVPTEAGRRLLDAARHLLSEVQDFEWEAQSLTDSEAQSLRIALGSYPAALDGHRAAAMLLERFPGLSCRIRVERWHEVADVLRQREADLVVCELTAGIRGDPTLHWGPISQLRGIFAVRRGHPLSSSGPLELSELLCHPLAGPRLPGRTADHLTRVVGGREATAAGRLDLRTGEFVPKIELDAVEQIRAVVRHSNAVGLVATPMIARELEEGALVALPVEADWLRLDYGFVHLAKRPLSETAAAFVEIMRERERALVEEDTALRRRLGLFIPDYGSQADRLRSVHSAAS